MFVFYKHFVTVSGQLIIYITQRSPSHWAASVQQASKAFNTTRPGEYN